MSGTQIEGRESAAMKNIAVLSEARELLIKNLILFEDGTESATDFDELDQAFAKAIKAESRWLGTKAQVCS